MKTTPPFFHVRSSIRAWSISAEVTTRHDCQPSGYDASRDFRVADRLPAPTIPTITVCRAGLISQTSTAFFFPVVGVAGLGAAAGTYVGNVGAGTVAGTTGAGAGAGAGAGTEIGAGVGAGARIGAGAVGAVGAVGETIKGGVAVEDLLARRL